MATIKELLSAKIFYNCLISIIIIILFNNLNSYAASLYGGSTCASAQLLPITVSPGSPFSYGVDTLFNKVNDYNSSNTNILSTFSPTYINGPDYLYYFTAPTTGPLTIKITYNGSSVRYLSVSLFEAGPGATLGQQVSGSYDAFTAGINPPGVLTTANVFAGTSYYILVDGYAFWLNSYYKSLYSIEVFYNDISPSCSNPDFESGDFSNWFGTIGRIENCYNPQAAHANYCPYNYGTNNSQFSIQNGGTDPYGGFPKIFQGNYSAMIGDGTNTEAYGAELINTFLVSANASAFTVSYAMVVQDGNHEDTIQSFVKISMFDQYGNEIECGNYLAIAAINTNGFYPSSIDPEVSYKPWTSVTTDLSPYINELVTIKITAGDCSGLAHFGYAYIDCSCTVVELTASGCSPVTITAPLGFDSYLWSPGGQTSQSINVFTSGEYCCDLIQNGCTLNICKDVNVGNLDISLSSQNVSCHGANDGSASITINGTPNYNYNWSNGQTVLNTTDTINEISSLPAGDYIISITDGIGCTGIDTITISEPPPLNVSAGIDQTVCLGEEANLNATASGGSGIYSFLWNNGSVLDSTVATPVYGSNNYSITVTDNCGSVTDQVSINGIYCCSIDSITYTVIPCSPLPNNYSISGLIYFTNPPPTGLLIVSNNCSTHIIQMDPPFTNPAGFTFLTLNADGNTCEITASFSVASGCNSNLTYTAPNTVNVNPGSPLTLTCSSPSGSLNASSTFPGVQYTWFGPGIVTGNNTSSPTVNISGIYYVTATDPISGCTASSSVSVISNTLSPVLTICNPITLTCSNTNGNLSVTSNTNSNIYSWAGPGITNGQNTASPTINVFGNYTVTVTDNSNGCSSTASVQVYTDTIDPNLTPGVETTLQCVPNNIVIFASSITPGVQFTWFGPGIINGVNTNSPTVNQPGSYTVIATNPLNGCTASASVNVNAAPLPQCIITETTPIGCHGYSNGTATVTANGGTIPYTYIWGTIPAQTNETAINLSAGNWSVIVTDAGGCTSTATVTINQPEPVLVSVVPSYNACPGESVTITAVATGGTPQYSYYWNNILMSSSITLTAQTPSTYNVYVIDANGCVSNQKTTNINVYPALHLSAQASPDSVCPGEVVVISFLPSGGTGDPYTIKDQNGNIISPPYLYYPASSTSLNFTAIDNCNQIVNVIVPINVYPSPPNAFLADVIEGCQPLTVSFNEINPQSGQSYVWDFGDNIDLSLDKNPRHTYSDYGSFDVTLTVTSINNCKTINIYPNFINVYPKPIAMFTSEPQFATILNPIIHFYNLSEMSSNYIWHFGTGDSSSILNPVYRFPFPSTYDVTLIAVSDFGCKDTAIEVVKINDEGSFYAPTAFSPDFDGTNDVFYVLGTGFKEDNFNLSVIDRWGQIIWETNKYNKENPSEYSWDGRSKTGEIVPIGTYTWLVKYRDINNNGKEKAGTVTVIK